MLYNIKQNIVIILILILYFYLKSFQETIFSNYKNKAKI
jgi:hypothetical protein